MTDALHHLEKRKRVHQKRHFFKKKGFEPYPNPHGFKAFVDHLIYVVGIVGPMFGAAQVYKIWTTQNAAGISLMLFGSHIIFNMVWLTYGFLHKEKPIIIMYTLWLIVNSFIVAGAILYG